MPGLDKVVLLALLLTLLPNQFLGAAIHGQEGELLRREASNGRVTAKGEIVMVDKTGSYMMKVSDLLRTTPAPQPVQSCSSSGSEGCCMFDFPLGQNNSELCDPAKSGTEKFSDMDEGMCIWAASEAGATTEPDTFKIPQSYEGERPKGCFLYRCNHNPGKWCYFWNGMGFFPNSTHKVGGRPVCHRPRYINGTAEAGKNYTDNLCGNEDYEVINTEERCRYAASCQSFCKCGDEQSGSDSFAIDVLNGDMQKVYPPGCFLQTPATDRSSCVCWNPATDFLGGTKGTPLCRVKDSESGRAVLQKLLAPTQSS